MGETVINETYSNLIPQIAEQAGIPTDHVIDIFNALGGSELKSGN